MNTQRLKKISQKLWYHTLPVKPGQFIEIHETVWEANNIRTWKFKWLVIKVKKRNQSDGTFTVRWKTAGHTIEKIYPLSFTKFEKVLLLDTYKVRRAKLYFIRDKVGKWAKFQSIATIDDKGLDLLELAKSNIVPWEEETTEDESIESTEAEIDQVIDQAEGEQKEEQVEEQKEEQAEEQKEEQVEEQKEEQAEEQKEEQAEEQKEEEQK